MVWGEAGTNVNTSNGRWVPVSSYSLVGPTHVLSGPCKRLAKLRQLLSISFLRDDIAKITQETYTRVTNQNIGHQLISFNICFARVLGIATCDQSTGYACHRSSDWYSCERKLIFNAIPVGHFNKSWNFENERGKNDTRTNCYLHPTMLSSPHKQSL